MILQNHKIFSERFLVSPAIQKDTFIYDFGNSIEMRKKYNLTNEVFCEFKECFTTRFV